MITPFPPEKCGIATYASKLVARLANQAEVVVIASKNGEDQSTVGSSVRVIRTWNKSSALYVFQVMKQVTEESPDIIHIQHEYLAYGPRKYSVLFPVLLLLLRLLRRTVVVTMHSVVRINNLTGDFFFDHQAGRRFAAVKRALMVLFTRTTVSLSDAVIVHNEYMRNALIKDYRIEGKNVVVIPHGFDVDLIQVDSLEAKKELRLSGKRVLLFSGFVIPGKGVEVLIKSFSELCRKLTNVTLVIAGGYHPRLFRELPSYIGAIERLIRDLRLDDNVIFENGFISNQRLQIYVSAADVVVFPYTDDSILGASGALATCASTSKVLIATRIPRFTSDLKNGVNAIIVEPNNIRQLSDAMGIALGDPKLRENLERGLRAYAMERNWDRISILTYEVYLTRSGLRNRSCGKVDHIIGITN